MHAINWFEIPAQNLERAQTFYAAMLDRPLERAVRRDGEPIAMFAAEGVGGCIVVDPKRKPSSEGTLPYLAVSDVQSALALAQAAGGEVVLPRTSVGVHGFMGLVRDTEGNVVGVHAMT
jgi:predicted enzyme related to lactoylglutathione lyase